MHKLPFKAVVALSLAVMVPTVPAAPVSAQTRPPNPTQQQVPVQDQPVAIFRVTVVGRTTPAVNYRHRGGATKVDFRGTPLLPRARGEAKVESKQGYIEIEVEFDELEPATQFGPEYLTYVMWAITPEGRATNLGEVLLNGTESKLNVTTELQAFGLIVTAEPYFAVSQPSDVVVMENVIRATREARSKQVEARYELLKRGTYLMDADPSRVGPATSGPAESRWSCTKRAMPCSCRGSPAPTSTPPTPTKRPASARRRPRRIRRATRAAAGDDDGARGGADGGGCEVDRAGAAAGGARRALAGRSRGSRERRCRARRVGGRAPAARRSGSRGRSARTIEASAPPSALSGIDGEADNARRAAERAAADTEQRARLEREQAAERTAREKAEADAARLAADRARAEAEQAADRARIEAQQAASARQAAAATAHGRKPSSPHSGSRRRRRRSRPPVRQQPPRRIAPAGRSRKPSRRRPRCDRGCSSS